MSVPTAKSIACLPVAQPQPPQPRTICVDIGVPTSQLLRENRPCRQRPPTAADVRKAQPAPPNHNYEQMFMRNRHSRFTGLDAFTY